MASLSGFFVSDPDFLKSLPAIFERDIDMLNTRTTI